MFFTPRASANPILDKIDWLLAAYYGFTDEATYCIPSTKLRAVNYDIKYRMGRDVEVDDE